jgi:hypothetical protein
VPLRLIAPTYPLSPRTSSSSSPRKRSSTRSAHTPIATQELPRRGCKELSRGSWRSSSLCLIPTLRPISASSPDRVIDARRSLLWRSTPSKRRRRNERPKTRLSPVPHDSQPALSHSPTSPPPPPHSQSHVSRHTKSVAERLHLLLLPSSLSIRSSVPLLSPSHPASP